MCNIYVRAYTYYVYMYVRVYTCPPHCQPESYEDENEKPVQVCKIGFNKQSSWKIIVNSVVYHSQRKLRDWSVFLAPFGTGKAVIGSSHQRFHVSPDQLPLS